MFLGGGTGVFCRDVVGLSLGVCWSDRGFPLGVVDLGPPVDVSKKLGVLPSRPIPGWGVFPIGLEMVLNISVFLKSSLK